MPNILDHASQAPVLDINDWPQSATREKWFLITRRIIQDTIADMNLIYQAVLSRELNSIQAVGIMLSGTVTRSTV